MPENDFLERNPNLKKIELVQGLGVNNQNKDSGKLSSDNAVQFTQIMKPAYSI